MKTMKLNNKGVMSIVSIILILIIAMVASGFVTILQRTMIIREVQGIMDTSGLMALRNGVDKELWLQEEKLSVETSIVSKQYKELVSDEVSKMTAIHSHSYKVVKVHEPNSPGLKTLGIPNGERDQYYLESMILLKIDRPSQFGPGSNLVWGFYNFFSGENGNQHNDVTSTVIDGEDALIIRSVTRLVLR